MYLQGKESEVNRMALDKAIAGLVAIMVLVVGAMEIGSIKI